MSYSISKRVSARVYRVSRPLGIREKNEPNNCETFLTKLHLLNSWQVRDCRRDSLQINITRRRAGQSILASGSLLSLAGCGTGNCPGGQPQLHALGIARPHESVVMGRHGLVRTVVPQRASLGRIAACQDAFLETQLRAVDPKGRARHACQRLHVGGTGAGFGPGGDRYRLVVFRAQFVEAHGAVTALGLVLM